uniref:Putative secreted protein n=1 Tax=Ixodes ricinus TaxID=34613 RepID=A0A147BQD0_IXORI
MLVIVAFLFYAPQRSLGTLTPNHSKLRRTHPVLRRPVTLKIRRVNVKYVYFLSVGPSGSLKPGTKLFTWGSWSHTLLSTLSHKVLTMSSTRNTEAEGTE